MIKVPYEQILEQIRQKSGLPAEEIGRKVKDKMDMLAGLISKEGAAHIIANEYGIHLFDAPKSSSKIKNLLPGMRDVEITARVVDVYDLREFERTGGAKGKVRSALLADETGRVRAAFWGDRADDIAPLKAQDIIKIRSGYIKENQSRIEVHAGDRSQIIINPPGETVSEGQSRRGFVRKPIGSFGEQDADVELFGTVVSCYPPTFFEVCPQCNKRIRAQEGAYTCELHGAVTPAYSCVMNCILDDGTGTIRCVFFRRQAEHLIAKPWEEILAVRTEPGAFQSINLDLLGRTIKVGGRVSKNALFERLEFVVQIVVDRNPDPKEEMAALTAQGINVAAHAEVQAPPDAVNTAPLPREQANSPPESAEEHPLFDEEKIL